MEFQGHLSLRIIIIMNSTLRPLLLKMFLATIVFILFACHILQEKIEEIVKLYEGEIKLYDGPVLSSVRDRISSQILRKLL